MQSIILTIAILFLFSFSSRGQGAEMNGLRVGHWTLKYENVTGRFTRVGNYKIVPLSQYDTIRDTYKSYEIRYKGSRALLLYNDRRLDIISVEDSIWTTYDEDGRVREIEDIHEGVSQSIRYFDENGNMTEFDYHDYENDTSFYLTYVDGLLFRKSFYPPDNKVRTTSIYYPERELSISDAELSFKLNFLKASSAVHQIVLRSKTEIVLQSISAVRPFTQIVAPDGENLSFPITLRPETPLSLNVVVTPTPGEYERLDTLTILTQADEQLYKIYTVIDAHHINYETMGTQQSIHLSRSKDRYLVLPAFGKRSQVYLTSEEGNVYSIKAVDMSKTDLSAFAPGEYKLVIVTCGDSGETDLILSE